MADGDLTFGVAIKSTGDGSVVSDAKAATTELENMKKATDDLAAASVKQASQSRASGEQMQEYWTGLSVAEDNAKAKAWALANGYQESGGVMVKATKEVADNVHVNSLAMRESLVLVREAARGNFSRMAGSASLLAQATGILPALLSPVGIAVGVVGGAIAGMAAAAYEGSKELDDMNRSLAMTNDYSGQTSDSLRALAVDISTNSQLTIGQSKDVAIQLAASGKIGQDAFDSVAAAVAAYAAATGESEAKVTPIMLKLFADPAKGAAELNSTMHFLNATQLEHIATLEREGQVTQAQLALADALNEKFKGQHQNIGLLQGAWQDLGKAASSAWDSLEGLGRDDTLEEKIKAAQVSLAQATQLAAASGNAVAEYNNEKIKDQINLNFLLAAQKKSIADATAKGAAAEQLDYDNTTIAIAKQNSELWKTYLVKEQLARVTGGGSVDAPSNDAIMQDAAAALSKKLAVKHDGDSKLLADAQHFDDQMLESDKSSFAKRIDEWVKFENIIEAKIKSGDAGAIEEKKLHAAALDALTLAEYNKLTAAAAKQQQLEAQHQAAAINSENAYFARIQAMADAADQFSGNKKNLQYNKDLITLNAEHAKTAALVKNDHDKKLAEQEAYEIALANLKQAYAIQTFTVDTSITSMISAFNQNNRTAELTSTLGYFEQLSSFGASHHRAMFEINKVASESSAIVNTYEAATEALKLGPIEGPIMAIAITALGMAKVDAINSTQFGGGAANSGGGGIPSLATSPGVPVTPASPKAAVSATPVAAEQAPQQFNFTIIGAKANPDTATISFNTAVAMINALNQAGSRGHKFNANLIPA